MVHAKLYAYLGKGKKKIYDKDKYKGPMDVKVTQSFDGIESEFYPLKQLVLPGVEPPTPVNIAPKVDAGDDLQVEVGTKGVELKGEAIDEDGRVVRSEWKQLLTDQAPAVELTQEENNPLNVSFDAPDEVCQLMFQLEAEDDKGEIKTDATIVYVGEKPKPPVPPVVEDGDYPIKFDIFYCSDDCLNHPGKFPTKKRDPYDNILLFSNASGVQYHIIREKWLIISTGQDYGRVYWEFYELPQYKDTDFGFTMVFAGIFKLTDLKNDNNFSTKFGDHGTTGYDYDGEKFFGGFGLSFHESGLESKTEYRHGTNGKAESQKYPDSAKLQVGVEYSFLILWKGDQSKNTMTMNVWMILDKAKGWQHAWKDRVWDKNAEWVNNSKTIPSDALDYEAVQKGPGFIRCDHVWTRANSVDVMVQKIRAGLPIAA